MSAQPPGHASAGPGPWPAPSPIETPALQKTTAADDVYGTGPPSPAGDGHDDAYGPGFLESFNGVARRRNLD